MDRICQREGCDKSLAGKYRNAKWCSARCAGFVWRAHNRAKVSAWSADYYAANRSKVLAHQLAYRVANPERVRGSQRRWYIANQDNIRDTQISYMQTERGKEGACRKQRKRRAIKAGLPDDGFTTQEIFERDGGLCWHCGCPVARKDGHVEHLVGYANKRACPGNVRVNVAWSCAACNYSKPKLARPIDWESVDALVEYYEGVTHEQSN